MAAEPIKPEVVEEIIADPKKKLEGIAVGGHGGTALLQTEDGKIKKRVNRDPELKFYQHLDEYNLGHGLKFIPKYFGSEVIEEADYIVMEDLTHNKKKCCVMDIKIGKVTYDERDSEEKKARMAAKDVNTTSNTIGQRLTGYRVWVEGSGFQKVGKDVSMKLSPAEYKEYILKFFDNGKGVRYDIIKHLLPQIKEFSDWAVNQKLVRVYSSSLLFVYDAANPSPNGEIKWIDFAHVIRVTDDKKDENFIFGIKKLMDMFEDFLANSEKK